MTRVSKIAIALISRRLKGVDEKTKSSLKLCKATSFIFDKNTSSRDNKIPSCNDGTVRIYNLLLVGIVS